MMCEMCEMSWMRTTLTIDDSLDRKLKQIVRQSGKSYKQVVNETLKRGLASPELLRRECPLEPSSLGEPLAGYDLTSSLQLADQPEDHELRRKLKQRK